MSIFNVIADLSRFSSMFFPDYVIHNQNNSLDEVRPFTIPFDEITLLQSHIISKFIVFLNKREGGG